MLNREQNPWLGLASYTTEDADRFYGRQNEINNIANAIRQHYCTIIYGKSGTGKTSLINAGVIPTMRQDQYIPVSFKLDHNSGHLPYDEQIIQAISNIITAAGGEIEPSLTDKASSLVPTQHQLWTFFHTNTFWSADNRRIIPVVFIDQFEEIFTLTEHPDEPASFFTLIQELLQIVPTESLADALHQGGERLPYQERPSFRIILSLREDFLARLEDHSYFIPELRQNRIGLAALSGMQALDVVLHPNPDLISRPVALQILSKISHRQVNDNKAQLELLHVDTCILSLFCSELYKEAVRLKKQIITAEMVNELGDDIIQSFYEHSVKDLSATSLRYLEEHLLTKSGFRNALAYEDVVPAYVSKKEIEHLESNRIVCRERVNGVERIEFSHDVLCAVAANHRSSRRNKSIKSRLIVAYIESGIVSLVSIGLFYQNPDPSTALCVMLFLLGVLLHTAMLQRLFRSILSMGLQVAVPLAIIYQVPQTGSGISTFSFLFVFYSAVLLLFELSKPSILHQSQFYRSLLNRPFRLCLGITLLGMLIISTGQAIIHGDPFCRAFLYIGVFPITLSTLVCAFSLLRKEDESQTWRMLFSRDRSSTVPQWFSVALLAILVPSLCIKAHQNRYGTVRCGQYRLTVVKEHGRYGLKEGDNWVLPPIYSGFFYDNAESCIRTKLFDQQTYSTSPVTDLLRLSDDIQLYDETWIGEFAFYHNSLTDKLDGNNLSMALYYSKSDSLKATDYTIDVISDILGKTRDQILSTWESFTSKELGLVYNGLRNEKSLLAARIPFVTTLFESAMEAHEASLINKAFYHIFLGDYEQARLESLKALEQNEIEGMAATNLFTSLLFQNKLQEAHEIYSIYSSKIVYLDERENKYRIWDDCVADDLMAFAKAGLYDEIPQEALDSTYSWLQPVTFHGTQYQVTNEDWNRYSYALLHNGKRIWLDPNNHPLLFEVPLFDDVMWTENDVVCCKKDNKYYLFDTRNRDLDYYGDGRIIIGYNSFGTKYEAREALRKALTSQMPKTSEDIQTLLNVSSAEDCHQYLLLHNTDYRDEIEELIDSYTTLQHEKEYLNLSKISSNNDEEHFNVELRSFYKNFVFDIPETSLSEYDIPNDMLISHPLLVKLVFESRSIETRSQKQEWFDLYRKMNEQQVIKLYDILLREKIKLSEIEIKNSEKRIEQIKEKIRNRSQQ